MSRPDRGGPRAHVRVPAKINLALRVGGRRPDGYHGLATVFLAVSIEDDVVAVGTPAAPGRPGTITAEVSGEGADEIGPGRDNLAVRAAELLRDRLGRPELGVSLSIAKRIPVTGGMAGGSADAAGALVACAKVWGIDAGPAELGALAAELGADVPFPLLGGCALGLGRGDRLTPVLCRGPFWWVLAVAGAPLSTAEVFRRFDRLGAGGSKVAPGPAVGPVAQGGGGAAGVRRPAPADVTRSGLAAPAIEPAGVPPALLEALAAGDAVRLGASLVNDLEPAARSLMPTLGRTLEAGHEAGALGAVVAGSGPTVAFLAADETAARQLAVRLSSEGVARALRLARGPVPGARLVAGA